MMILRMAELIRRFFRKEDHLGSHLSEGCEWELLPYDFHIDWYDKSNTDSRLSRILTHGRKT